MTSTPQISIERVDPETWSDVAQGFADYNFEQSSDYAKSMVKDADDGVDFYLVRDHEAILGGACVRIKRLPFVRRGIAYISGGVLAKTSDAMSFEGHHKHVLGAIRRELVEKQKHHLFVRAPILPADQSDLHNTFTALGFTKTEKVRHYRTVLMDIRPELDVIRANLKGKWRTDLNYANKMGLQLEQGADAGFYARFMAMFGDMVDAKNFDVQVDPNAFFKLPPNSTGLVVMIATKDGKDVAGHVLSLLGNTAVYLFGASNELGRATKAGYWMNWQAIDLARRRGMHWYDLGGVDPDANPGGYRFKNRMGGQDVFATGPYEARPGGVLGALIQGALNVRARLKK